VWEEISQVLGFEASQAKEKVKFTVIIAQA
jgi:hypothetical protein